MIVSQQKPLTEILDALRSVSRVFIVGCAKCATVCKSGGEEEVWQMQEALTAAGKEVTGTLVIDEACHMLRVGRDFRAKQALLDEAEAILTLTCGAGIQSVAAAADAPTIAGLDTLFLGNIKRFGHFEQRCSLCGECMLTSTAGICPVTLCPKGLLNGPCGGMDAGNCETNAEAQCAWYQIFVRVGEEASSKILESPVPPKDHAKVMKPGDLKVRK